MLPFVCWWVGVRGRGSEALRFATSPEQRRTGPLLDRRLDMPLAHAGDLGSGAGVMWQSEAPLNPSP